MLRKIPSLYLNTYATHAQEMIENAYCPQIVKSNKDTPFWKQFIAPYSSHAKL